MAYGLLYKFRAESAKYKDDVKINILKKDYAGSSYDKYLGSRNIILTKDSEGVICGTSLAFIIQADTDFEYLDFFEASAREYLVQLLINDAVIWQGYLIGDEYREAFRNPPYDVAVLATDGLGLLKNYDYTIQASPGTKVTRIGVIRGLLSNTGLSLNISVAYDVDTPASTNLFNVGFSDDYYSGWTCYEVLEKMIPPDATITQHNGIWMIRRNELDSETTPKVYSYIDGIGYIVSNGTAETPLSLAPMGSGDVYPIGQAELNMQHAWKSMEFFSEHGKRPSMLYNHNFADGLTHWTEGPTTGYVEAWDSDQGSYVKIIGEHTATSEDVPEVYVKQSFPFTAVSGQDFAISFKFCANGYLILIGVGKKKTNVTIKGRVEYTDGSTTYYLDETDGWSLTNRNFEYRDLGNIGSLVWKDFKIYASTPPLASGTMTVYLYGYVTDPNTTLVNVCFTDVVVFPMIWEDYPASYRYEVEMKDNATETNTVTVMPTDAPDVANFDRLFYNGQTVSGALADDFVSGSDTYTFANLMMNSLKFLHGTSRQMITGYFRGSGLSLNSVISAASTNGRKYVVASGAWDVMNDKFNLNLLEIPGSASGSTWAMGTTDFSTSAEWSNNTTVGGGGSQTIGGGGEYIGGGGSWLDPYFELVNSGTTGEYIRALRDFASTGEITAYNASDTTGSNMWDAMPIATTGDLGGVIVDGTTITINELGVISSAASGGGGASSYTLDFQASAVVMNDINLEGAITITDIIGLNVDTLKLDNVAQVLGSGLSIAVSNQQILSWEITRTAPGYAALGIKFTKS